MTPTEASEFLKYLHGVYGEAFPVLTLGMQQDWIEVFEGISKRQAWEALKEWRVWHPLSHPPTRKQLLDIVGVQEPAMRPVTATAMPATIAILVEAAAHAPHAHDAWAKCHVEMVQDGLGMRDLEATAQRCETYAMAYPDEAGYWQKEAAWWRDGAQGPLRF